MFIHDLGVVLLTVKLVSKGVTLYLMVIHAHVMEPVPVMISWGLSMQFFKPRIQHELLTMVAPRQF